MYLINPNNHSKIIIKYVLSVIVINDIKRRVSDDILKLVILSGELEYAFYEI